MTDDLYHKQLESMKLESMATTDLLDMLRERDKRIEKLEKALSVCNASNSFNKEQLTKAKEIIKRYVKIYVNPYPEEEIELRNEAEQFLKEADE